MFKFFISTLIKIFYSIFLFKFCKLPKDLTYRKIEWEKKDENRAFADKKDTKIWKELGS